MNTHKESTILLNRGTDRQWEKFGRDDPYYGVSTDDKYRRIHLTEQAKRDRGGELGVNLYFQKPERGAD